MRRDRTATSTQVEPVCCSAGRPDTATIATRHPSIPSGHAARNLIVILLHLVVDNVTQLIICISNYRNQYVLITPRDSLQIEFTAHFTNFYRLVSADIQSGSANVSM